MSDLAQHSKNRADSEPWQGKANPDHGYGGNEGGMEDPPPSGGTDMPGDPTPPVADQEYGGQTGGEEDPPPSGGTDMPGEPPSPDVAENNGR